jgi:hypothetical protein
MREQEMRLRVFRFLKARMRNMIMPATVGIGLGGAGCFTQSGAVYSAPMVRSDANRDVDRDDVPVQGPDVSQPERPEAQAAADLAQVEDVAAAIDQGNAIDSVPGSEVIDSGLADVSSPRDARAETGMKYMGPIPSDAAASEASSEAGQIFAKYVAPMLDAAADGMPVVRYMGPMPDAGA